MLNFKLLTTASARTLRMLRHFDLEEAGRSLQPVQLEAILPHSSSDFPVQELMSTHHLCHGLPLGLTPSTMPCSVW